MRLAGTPLHGEGLAGAFRIPEFVPFGRQRGRGRKQTGTGGTVWRETRKHFR